MKLATKFTALLVVGVLILFAVDGYLAVQRDIEMFDEDMQQDALTLSEMLQPSVADHWQQGGHEQVRQFLDRISQGNGLVDLPSDIHQIVRVRWVLLDAPRNHQLCPVATHEELRQIVSGHMCSVKHEDQAGVYMVTYARVAIDDSRPAAFEIVQPRTHSTEKIRRFGNRVMVLTAIAVLAGIAMVVLLGRELVGRPLQTLIDKTRRIGQGDLSGPVQLQRRDEFGELATAINSMCDQLGAAQEKVDTETSARIAAFEQLRHADRLRTVGQLAAGIAHEIGTPLNVVGGRADMIASTPLSHEETRKNAEIIKTEADRIATIIRQLLDFARRGTPHRTKVDMHRIVTQTIELLRPLAEKRRVKIDCIAPADSFTCDVDAEQLQQVLTNLFINAIHAAPQEDTVEVDLRRQRLTPPDTEQAATGEYLLISVRDNGQGIAEEDLPKIFEPFFTTKQVGEGTGLGLSIAFGIAEEHGGWIDVQSEIGRGSCFTLHLPLEDKA